MGNIGFPELVVIFVVALLVFGPKRLPELGRSLGRGITEFRRATSGVRETLEREIENAEVQAPAADLTNANEASKSPSANKA